MVMVLEVMGHRWGCLRFDHLNFRESDGKGNRVNMVALIKSCLKGLPRYVMLLPWHKHPDTPVRKGLRVFQCLYVFQTVF